MNNKSIGASFESELETAGLLGLPFSWGSDGEITFDHAMTSAEISAVEAVYSAHDPSKLNNGPAAAALLDKADVVMHRISEAVTLGLNSWTSADVVAWVNYRRALRAIVSGAISNSIPARPAYPQGT